MSQEYENLPHNKKTTAAANFQPESGEYGITPRIARKSKINFQENYADAEDENSQKPFQQTL